VDARSTWSNALACATRLAPAEEWRSSLAAAVRSASRAVFTAVCTCPHGMFVAPSATTDPPSFGPVVEQIIGEFLPRVERAGDGTDVVALIGPNAYAPLEIARHPKLRARFRREILKPIGANGLLNVFLLGRNREVLGWIAVGTQTTSSDAKRQYADALDQLALRASATLQSAIDLASACGLVPLRSDGTDLIKLSVREHEIAELIADGYTNVNIAAKLTLSEQTVASHLRRMFAKLGVHSRGELSARLGPLLLAQQGRFVP
jgi:DNA-binding CsgD family transcriptional regulator